MSFFGGDFYGGGFYSVDTPVNVQDAHLFGVRPSYRKKKKKKYVTFEEMLEAWQRALNPASVEIIQSVALRQVQTPDFDEQKRLEELERELEAADIEWDSRFLAAVKIERERLIDAEIKQRLKERMNEEDAILLIMLAVHI